MNLFGVEYEEVGSNDKNLLLVTKGKVKIKIGNKIIDLIDENNLDIVSNSDN